DDPVQTRARAVLPPPRFGDRPSTVRPAFRAPSRLESGAARRRAPKEPPKRVARKTRHFLARYPPDSKPRVHLGIPPPQAGETAIASSSRRSPSTEVTRWTLRPLIPPCGCFDSGSGFRRLSVRQCSVS